MSENEFKKEPSLQKILTSIEQEHKRREDASLYQRGRQQREQEKLNKQNNKNDQSTVH